MLEDIKEVARLREHASFIGYEFLTWLFLLLHRSDVKDQLLSMTDGIVFKNEIEINLGSKLVTCLLNNKEQKTAISSSILEESHEVFICIKNGHLIESLSLVITLGEIDISLLLHASDFAFAQSKLKQNFAAESSSDADDNLDEADRVREELFLRLCAVDDAEKIIDSVFHHFLRLRLDYKKYTTSLSEMCTLVEDRLEKHLAVNKDLQKNIAISPVANDLNDVK